MEISLVKDNSIKIKGNKTSIVTDPVSIAEAQIVLLTGEKTYELDKVEGTRLVLEGPGEYEVGGISIFVKNLKGDLVFNITLDSSKILLLSASAIAKLQEEDEYDGVIIKVNDKVSEEILSKFNSGLVILYGDLSNTKLNPENTVNLTKVNLKKRDGITGKIVLLTV